MKFEPADIIAVVCILGAFGLKYCGIDTIVDGVIAVIIGYYFGAKSEILRNFWGGKK